MSTYRFTGDPDMYSVFVTEAMYVRLYPLDTAALQSRTRGSQSCNYRDIRCLDAVLGNYMYI